MSHLFAIDMNGQTFTSAPENLPEAFESRAYNEVAGRDQTVSPGPAIRPEVAAAPASQVRIPKTRL